MLNIDAIFAEPTTTNINRPLMTAVVDVLVAENSTAHNVATSEPTTPLDSRAVEPIPALDATSGVGTEDCEAVRNEAPRPCSACGSAILWRTPDGKLTCCGCTSKTDEAVKVVIVTLPDGRTALEPFTSTGTPNPVNDYAFTECK